MVYEEEERIRIKIFCQCLGHKTISQNRGDFITEIHLMKALSGFAEVYYSGSRFRPNAPNLGMKNYNGTILARSRERKYDFYYVRNNPKLFRKLPRKSIYFVSPYDKLSFNIADGIATLTDSWTRRLRKGVTTHGFPPNYKNDRVFTSHQVLDDSFKPLQNHPRTKAIRKSFGGNFVIGHFGSLRKSCFPFSLLKVLPNVLKEHPKTKVVFSTKTSQNCRNIVDKNIIERKFGYRDMPFAISACDLILYNFRGSDGHFIGSMKILEAMGAGVPILSPRFDAREEELGKNYELFYDFTPNGGRFSTKSEKQLVNKLIMAIEDHNLRSRISKKLLKRVKFYRMAQSVKRLKKTLEGIR